jgi:hypothetical protein
MITQPIVIQQRKKSLQDLTVKMEQSRRQGSGVKISKQWSCDKCMSKFGRLDHLKRHELSR